MVIVTSFQEPESRILYQQHNTRAVLDKHDLGVGTIIVSERTLCWKEQGTTGFSIEYGNISMHAITSDRNVYPTDCIFLMIDGHLVLSNVPQDDEEEDSDSDDEQISELLFIPQDPNSIRLIYNALCECQVLNPDANDEVDEEDEYVYEDANEFNGSAEEMGSDLGAGGDTELVPKKKDDRAKNQNMVGQVHFNKNLPFARSPFMVPTSTSAENNGSFLEMNHLANQFHHQSINYGNFNPNGNGDQNIDEEQFEDAD